MYKLDNLELENLVKRISKLKYVSAIFLFGSQVNWNARNDSDFDIAVLTKNSSYDEEMNIIGYGNDKFDVKVFSRLPLIIKFRVFKEGKVVFCRNEKDVYDTKVVIFKHYLDFAPVIDRFYRRVIENVKKRVKWLKT